MSNSVDTATLVSLARNRGKLLRLAESIKARKKPGSKRTLNLKLDPGYTNIEHLVFGTYRPRSSTPVSPILSSAAATSCPDHDSDEVPSRCECSAHSPRRSDSPNCEKCTVDCPGLDGEIVDEKTDDSAKDKNIVEAYNDSIADVSSLAPGAEQNLPAIETNHACRSSSGYESSRAMTPFNKVESVPPSAGTGNWVSSSPDSCARHPSVIAENARTLEEAIVVDKKNDMALGSQKNAGLLGRSESFQQRSSSAMGFTRPGATNVLDKQKIIQVDLQSASRPKPRDHSMVYSLQPVNGPGSPVKMVSCSDAVLDKKDGSSGIPKPRVLVKRPSNEDAVVCSSCAHSSDGHSEASSNGSSRNSSGRSTTGQPVITPAHQQVFRKSASVSEKSPVKPINIPVIRNATIHRWTGTPRQQPSSGKPLERTTKSGILGETNKPKANPPVVSCRMPSSGNLKAAQASRQNAPGCYSFREPRSSHPCNGNSTASPKSDSYTKSSVSGSRLDAGQNSTIKPQDRKQDAFVSARAARPSTQSSRRDIKTAEVVPVVPMKHRRNDERLVRRQSFHSVPQSGRSVPPSPYFSSLSRPQREALSPGDVISPPGMFKDEATTHQDEPALSKETLSKWVGATTNESAKLLHQLANYAESKLSCRVYGQPLKDDNKQPENSVARNALNSVEQWYNQLKESSCSEALPNSPESKTISETMHSTSKPSTPTRAHPPHPPLSKACTPTKSHPVLQTSRSSPFIGHNSVNPRVAGWKVRSQSAEEASYPRSTESQFSGAYIQSPNPDDYRANQFKQPMNILTKSPIRKSTTVDMGILSQSPIHRRTPTSVSAIFADNVSPSHKGTYSPSRSPHRSRMSPQPWMTTVNTQHQEVTSCVPVPPHHLRMSDIEEKDENSSSGPSRAPSEEPPDVALRKIGPMSPGYRGNLCDLPQEALRSQEWMPHNATDYKKFPGPCTDPLGPFCSSPVRNHNGYYLNGNDKRHGWISKDLEVENGPSLPESKREHAAMGVYSENISSTISTTEPSLLTRQLSDQSQVKTATSSPINKVLIGQPGRLIRNRPISRSERHLKATSTPEFHSGSTEDVGKDSRRPWSHLYSEVEAQRLLGPMASNSGSMPSIQRIKGDTNSHLLLMGEPAAPDCESGLSPRYSSLRASTPRLIADNMFQKFRKTFSLRFQKSRKGSTTSLQSDTQGDSDGTAKDCLGADDNAFQDNSPSLQSSPLSPRKPVQKTSSAPLARGEDDEERLDDAVSGGFKLGPLILRSSKERKKNRKQKEARGSKCSSADSGIQVETVCSNGEQSVEASSVEDDTSLQRNTMPSADKSWTDHCQNSDHKESAEGSTSLAEQILNQNGMTITKRGSFDSDQLTPFHTLRKSPSIERQFSTPPPIKLRTDRVRPILRRHKGKTRLRRSISQPLDLEKTGGTQNRSNLGHGLSDQEASREQSSASSDDEFSSDGENYLHGQQSFKEVYEEGVTYVEALWDHVTLDSEELGFTAGEVIEVTDMSDKDWWWGAIGNRNGWFPAAFVRLRVSQEDTVEDCISKMADGVLMRQKSRKMSVSLLSNEQVRANVVKEIVNTERDFVHHLKDVVEGYLKQVRRRPDMFSDERIATIFGNIEQLFDFQNNFLKHLECSIDWERPHLSEIGNCFLQHKDDFRIYSEYCNNHPLAVSELQELYSESKYVHFFEACRLLQDMIDISLDGFLLTPVQKICKYPLQLAELLKYTRADHPDHEAVADALLAMKGVAQMVNERKRRMECLEKLAEWQQGVDGWEGPDILNTSSMLIYSGDVVRVSSSWSRDVVSLFLFDCLLVYCKKDLLKRNTTVYKGRLGTDTCCVVDIEDGKDTQFGVSVKNAWKVYCTAREKWYLFYTKTQAEKELWLRAFKQERERVREDREQGYVVTPHAKKAAKLALHNKLKPKRPRAKLPKGPRTQHPDVAVVEILLDPPGPKPRTGSLPSNLHPAHIVPNHGLPKKKGSGWFHFGSGKKVKK